MTRLRPQYHFRRGSEGLYAWNVAGLIRAARDLAVVDVPLTAITEIDTAYWAMDHDRLTVRDIAEHARLIGAADISVPVLLCAEGRVMDGMHRVARALLEGRKSVPARRFDVTPPADFYPADPAALSYDPDDFQI